MPLSARAAWLSAWPIFLDEKKELLYARLARNRPDSLPSKL